MCNRSPYDGYWCEVHGADFGDGAERCEADVAEPGGPGVMVVELDPQVGQITIRDDRGRVVGAVQGTRLVIPEHLRSRAPAPDPEPEPMLITESQRWSIGFGYWYCDQMVRHQMYWTD